MAREDYQKALKKGERSYARYLSEGKYPYLQVLEELLSHTDVVAEEDLGICSIPSEMIVGTFTAGRRTAFAPNFMPLLDDESEFAAKWQALYNAHLEEGIHDPIKCYEFMNRYYVLEGNKRVSVLKFCGAPSVQGNVTRIIPKRTDEPENRLYFEFLAFYKCSKVNYIVLSKLGGYRTLLEKLGFDADYKWTDDDRMEVRSLYVRFEKVYKEKGGEQPPIPTADAFLMYLELYPCDPNHEEKLPSQIKSELLKMWDEILLQAKGNPSEIKTEPQEAPKKNLFDYLLSPGTKYLKIAFVHDKNPQDSAWIYGHELGRMYLEEQFKGKVETISYNDVSQGSELENTLDDAIAKKCNIIFTTTPQFLEGSIKTAIKNPSVKILNCSVDTNHQCIRTYYARLFEAKFLSGLVAGALCKNGKIGYMADYPICGMIANINAFAIGVKMVNPNATIQLEWTTVRSKQEILEDFKANEVNLVSCLEMIVPNSPSRYFGLVNIEKDEPENLTAVIWNWGALYKKLVETVQNGAWDSAGSDGVALNYWWGMSAGVVDFICSPKVPVKTRQLVEFMQHQIMEGGFSPFSGELYSQDGIVQSDDNRSLTPEEIINMRWLADNVNGSLPHWNKLNEDAKAVVEVQGVDNIEE